MARLFFAFHIQAQWPESFPLGRLLKPPERHLTLVFLGEVDKDLLLSRSIEFPLPPFVFSPTGVFDRPLLLPTPRKPRVLAWHANLNHHLPVLLAYYQRLTQWLHEQKIITSLDDRPFLPHVTIAREPFKPDTWIKSFSPRPFMMNALCLYESIGGLNYNSIWTHSFQSPVECVEHTADIAFRIRGTSLEEIHRHAQHVLLEECPELIDINSGILNACAFQTLGDVIMRLNRLISIGDRERGIRLKAVSYHGELTQTPEGFLEWEMIIDV